MAARALAGAQGPVPWCGAGESFSALFGAGQSQLEALMLKRKVMGPTWLQLKHPTRVEPQAQVSPRAPAAAAAAAAAEGLGFS